MVPRRTFAAVVLIGALAMGVAGCFNPFRPLISGLTSFVEPPPSPTNPQGVIRLFKWCWENRDITLYHEIFTEDYRFAFAITDSAGTPYRGNPWTREDELISAANLFVGGSASEPAASSISLIFDGELTPQNDFRQGKNPRWHQQIQIANLTLTINKSDGSAVRVTGGALFYLVRGDSATIPQELLDRNFGADSTRWYMERWEDQTNVGSGATSVSPAIERAAPAFLNPLERMSWGLAKRIWR